MLVTQREAKALGRQAGRNAASWMFDGNTKQVTYSAFVRGVENGDPEILDRFASPSWLSGEWAGESIPEILGTAETQRDVARLDRIIEIYEQAAETAYWRELERVARYMLED